MKASRGSSVAFSIGLTAPAILLSCSSVFGSPTYTTGSVSSWLNAWALAHADAFYTCDTFELITVSAFAVDGAGIDNPPPLESGCGWPVMTIEADAGAFGQGYCAGAFVFGFLNEGGYVSLDDWQDGPYCGSS